MSILFSFLILVLILFPYYSSLEFGSAQSLQHDHDQLLSESLRRSLGEACGSGNLIDECGACDPHWQKHRKRLAKCAMGFGKNATGGKNGKIYVVTNSSDDDVVNPKPGTLRYAVIQDEPLWIKFHKSMTIILKEELIMNSYKTIDGRGVEVVLTGKSGITVQNVRHVIIHDLTIHDMKPSGNTNVRSTPDHFGFRCMSDGDAISIFNSSDVWVDHCTLYHCSDGLIDVVEASTNVTISNNLFHHHNEVMLFGHSDKYAADVDMRVTVAYNVFGEGLKQRIPRCRFGRFEIIHNYYSSGWGIYAIGGTSKPTIVSRGNVFYAPDDLTKKEVASTSRTRQHPQQHHSYRRQANDSRRKLDAFSCESGNKIDDCWKCGEASNLKQNPKKLADCGVGYGKNAIGGKNGQIYVVTSDSDNNVVNPSSGTLRYGVIQEEPLWIMFSESMTIVLKEELIMASDKTIDGRGFDVVLTGKSGITVQNVSNVIIHSLTIHDMKPSGNTEVRSSTSHYGFRGMSDGDAICIFGSTNVWVDHCTLYHCTDGLIDVVAGSTDITISNNLFYDHNEVMLFGHSDDYTPDDNMRVSVLYNVFGEGLVQRMPRCRRGIFEIINNKYEGWWMYAIGGSANPTIYSKGNQYIASDNPYTKQVTYHPGHQNPAKWSTFLWKSEGDDMFNGAVFNITGAPTGETLVTNPSLASQVPIITAAAGALTTL